MKAFRIQNDIVAARDELEAIAAWAKYYGAAFNSSGPVEEIDPDEFEVELENEDETFRTGKVREVMPVDGPAEIICFGEHVDES